MKYQRIIYIIAVLAVLLSVLLTEQFGELGVRVFFCGILTVLSIGIHKLIFDEFL